jgi:hypothetical protein
VLDPSLTVIAGMTGSGKTTFGIKYLLNSPAACYLIFDWNDRIGPRLPFHTCYTANELETAVASRWVIFNPKRMFEGAMFDKKQGTKALRFFASFARDVVKRGRGKKFFYVPEVWNFCTEDSIPPELAMLCQDGRQDEVEVIVDTQRPELINESIMGNCTELVCFRLQGLDALRTVGKYGMDEQKVANLPIGYLKSRFIALNRLTGATLEGNPFDPPRQVTG